MILNGELIGIAGLNQDPYLKDTNIGRVRHLYIRKSYRRKGYAALLLKKIIDEAAKHYKILRLFTENDKAGLFYESVGFKKTAGIKVTHQMVL